MILIYILYKDRDFESKNQNVFGHPREAVRQFNFRAKNDKKKVFKTFILKKKNKIYLNLASIRKCPKPRTRHDQILSFR
jgi:hypothetical protein